MITAKAANNLAMESGRRDRIANELSSIEEEILGAAKEGKTFIVLRGSITSETLEVLRKSGYFIDMIRGVTISWYKGGINES